MTTPSGDSVNQLQPTAAARAAVHEIRAALARWKDVPAPIGSNAWSMAARRNANYGGAVLLVRDGAFITAA